MEAQERQADQARLIERWREREKERKIVILFSVILYFCFRFHDSFVARWLFLSLSRSLLLSRCWCRCCLSLRNTLYQVLLTFLCVCGGGGGRL